jgi:hypothetical protein
LVGVAVGVGVLVAVGVAVGVLVGVGVLVAVGVSVGVLVAIGVSVGVLVGVAVGVLVGVGVSVGVLVGVAVAVGVLVGPLAMPTVPLTRFSGSSLPPLVALVREALNCSGVLATAASALKRIVASNRLLPLISGFAIPTLSAYQMVPAALLTVFSKWSLKAVPGMI